MSETGNNSASDKEKFSLNAALAEIETSVSGFARAAMFELYDQGYSSVFEQLIGCIISIRTRDETTLKTLPRLFEKARTPQEIYRLTPDEIDSLIKASTFHEQKAYRIHQIAEIALNKYNGELPCEKELLTALPGVGNKCANLVLGVACGKPFISVDIHVHRVTNRWGLVNTKNPDKTMLALEKLAPPEKWIDINRLLVPFGKHICTGTMPKCSTCPVLRMCRQVGVTSYR